MKNSQIKNELDSINFDNLGYRFAVSTVKTSKKTIKVKLSVEPSVQQGLTLEELAGDPDGLGISEAFADYEEGTEMLEEDAQAIADTLNADFATHIWGNDTMQSELEETRSKVVEAVEALTETKKTIKVVFVIGQYDLWDADDILERWEKANN